MKLENISIIIVLRESIESTKSVVREIWLQNLNLLKSLD